MRVVRASVSRPPPSPKTREVVFNVPPPQAKKTIQIDENLLNEPIDFRKINPNSLPVTPLQIDDSKPTTPLSALFGKRIATPGDKGRETIAEVVHILTEINEQNKPHKPKQRLSKHLQPPLKYKFSPEIAYQNRYISRIPYHSGEIEKCSVSSFRQYPQELMPGSLLQSAQQRSKSAIVKPAYS